MTYDLHAFIPFDRAHINTIKREVWGWAASDELATDGRIHTHEANVRAFEDWFPRGNIREMHQSLAVGRAIAWEADEPSHRIWVGVRISEGAEDTWKKVQDGTLRGFSVKGVIRRKESRIVRRGNTQASIDHVLDYGIGELSLVDIPSDPAALVVDVVRADGLSDVLDTGELMFPIPSEEGDMEPEILERVDESGNLLIATDIPSTEETPQVDAEEIVRAESVTITPIGGPDEPVEGEILRAEDPATEPLVEAIATDEVVERVDDAVEAEVTASEELSQADMAGQALNIINQLIAREAGELPASDDDACVWDVYGLLQARSAIKGFISSEVAEVVTMARSAADLGEQITRLETQLTEAVERLSQVETSQAAVERGENPVVTELREGIESLREDVERYASQPLPGGPLVRPIPVEKLFAGETEGSRPSEEQLTRAFETIRKELDQDGEQKLNAFQADLEIRSIHRTSPSPILRG